MKKKLLSMRFVLTVLALLLCTSKLMADDNELKFKPYSGDTCVYLVENSYKGNVVIPEKVIYNGKEYKVTGIGKDTFKKCFRVTSITLPPSLRSFDADLSDCAFLERINISSLENFLTMYIGSEANLFPNSDEGLYLNGKLVESVVFTQKIPTRVLAGYKKLKNVTFDNPENTSIDNSTLAGCTNIDTLRFLSPNTSCGGWTSECYKNIYIYGAISTGNHYLCINADFLYLAGPSFEVHSSSKINVKTCLIDNNSLWTSSSIPSFNEETTIVVSPKIKNAYYLRTGKWQQSYIPGVNKLIFLNPSIKLPSSLYSTCYVANRDSSITEWNDYAKEYYIDNVKSIYELKMPTTHTFEYSGVSPFSAIGIVDSTDIVKTKWNEELLTKNVGEYEELPITFEVKGFKFDTSLPFKYTITKAPLTILADNKTREYGNENPVFTCTYYGLKNGEDENALDAKPIVYSTASADSPVGSYPIIPANAQSTNYTISYENGALTIVPASQTITWDQEITKAKVGDIIELTATSSANLKMKFSSSNTAVADIYTSKGKVYMECLAAGTARITASQAGDTNHAEADDIVKRITVEDISTSISGIESETKVVGYYSVDGRKVETPTKGLYIVKYADGHKRKVIIK